MPPNDTAAMSHPGTRRRVPRAVKLGYTVFVAILVPSYWQYYGPANFLFFCDLALFATLVTVWTEHPLGVSMSAVGILLPQAVWLADLLGTAVGHPLLDATAYMFDPSIPAFVRALSWYHVWLPLLILYLLQRLGYDRRALPAWSVLTLAVLMVCYFLLPPPPAPVNNPTMSVNINFVYGLGDDAPQDWMPPKLWLLTEIAVLLFGVFVPTHLLLRRWFREKR